MARTPGGNRRARRGRLFAEPLETRLMPTTLAVNPAVVQGPRVVSVQRLDYHSTMTTLVITFSAPLQTASAQNMYNYQITTPTGGTVLVKDAFYQPTTNSVTLQTVVPLNLHKRYTLTVFGTLIGGIRGATGTLLDGAGTGGSGSNFVTTVDAANLVVPVASTPGAASALKVAALARATDATRDPSAPRRTHGEGGVFP